jgi:hypothetical protein
MKHILRVLTGLGVAVALSAVPALAQEKVAAGPSGGGGGEKVAAPSAPSGGGSTGSSGGSSGGGFTGGGFNGGSGGRDNDSGRRGGATGGSGYSAPRGPRATDDGGGSNGVSVPSGERGRRTGDGSGRPNNTPGSVGGGDGVPTYSRPRDGNAPVGTAVPRGTTPPRPGTGLFVPGGYYGGYYGGYGYYDPYGYNGGYGYYGGYYDPWYGGYPTYPQGGGTYTSIDEGSLRLKIKPKQGEVYVDGYYVGVVDDFDGIFQRLHLDSGAHRIEVRAPGYEPLAFDVYITADHTTTYQGELKKIQ